MGWASTHLDRLRSGPSRSQNINGDETMKARRSDAIDLRDTFPDSPSLLKREKVDCTRFVPIVIVIETEAEAKRLWHRLNVGLHTTLTEHAEKNRMKADELLSGYMWTVLDRIYKP
jgi:hypothetical protein